MTVQTASQFITGREENCKTHLQQVVCSVDRKDAA